MRYSSENGLYRLTEQSTQTELSKKQQISFGKCYPLLHHEHLPNKCLRTWAYSFSFAAIGLSPARQKEVIINKTHEHLHLLHLTLQRLQGTSKVQQKSSQWKSLCKLAMVIIIIIHSTSVAQCP